MVVIVARETAMETESSAGSRRRCIGLDVHREFAQVAIWQGGLVTQAGRFATTPEGVRAFADGLGPADEVALEATGNTWAIATLLASRAGAGGGVQPGEDPGDRRGQGQDGQGRRGDPGAAAGRGLPAGGVAAGPRPGGVASAGCCAGRTSCGSGPG